MNDDDGLLRHGYEDGYIEHAAGKIIERLERVAKRDGIILDGKPYYIYLFDQHNIRYNGFSICGEIRKNEQYCPDILNK